MKRFHVHVAVNNLEESIRFYAGVFGAEPTVRKPDYAKWMVDDPRVNFAISSRGRAPGVNHLGFQVDSDEELAALRTQMAGAELPLRDEPNVSCCYAKGNKHWTVDPSGVAWESFHTLGDVPTFGATPEPAATEDRSRCCA